MKGKIFNAQEVQSNQYIMSIEKIKELVDKFVDNVDQGIREHIAHESIDKYHTSVYTTYSVVDDVKKLLLEIGTIINNQTLVNGFKKPKTIEEIIAEIKEDTCLSDFEEFEEIEQDRDAKSDSKYVYIIEIVKHIPTEKFYKFSTQTQGEYRNKPEFDGEVIKKEITTTAWVNKNER